MKQHFKSWHDYLRSHQILRYPYKGLVILCGIICIFLGILMLVLPGPGLLFIFFGMIILSTEIPIFKSMTAYISERFHELKTRYLPTSQKKSDKIEP